MVITNDMQKVKTLANRGDTNEAYKQILHTLICGYGDMLPSWVKILYEFVHSKEQTGNEG